MCIEISIAEEKISKMPKWPVEELKQEMTPGSVNVMRTERLLLNQPAMMDYQSSDPPIKKML